MSKREEKTLLIMIELFCQAHHGNPGKNCPQCTELARYAQSRLAQCRFSSKKPTCFKCTIHCYSKKYKEQIKGIMGFSGPRMLKKHFFLAVLHRWDSAMSERRIRKLSERKK
ncbi:MAG: nitrous oxide-stimulated promoter family protein [Deltaproteobacteria bacterium]|nr:nitrous oxide-stimulated promoter family protein [Deltaproteobacteria bacterium]